MHWPTLLLYTGTWLVVALTPGPAVMCAMTQSTRHGLRSGLAAIAGVQAGNVLFFFAIASGLAALLNAASTAFAVLRTVGAIYLFYLGVRLIVGAFRSKSSPEPGVGTKAPPAHHGLFLQGLLIQLTNPKALLFVSALLPQFLRPEGSWWAQLVSLGLVTVLVDTAVLAGYAALAERGLQSVRSRRVVASMEALFGAVLIAFGCRLFLARK